MLKIFPDSSLNRSRRRPRCRVYPGQKVSRKYRRAVVRRVEYRRLQKLIPNIARRRKVPELTVILEAVKYIDVLHTAIADRVRTIRGLQSVDANRKFITPNGRDVTNDPTQQVVFLSNRIYQERTGGANTALGHPYPHISSAAISAPQNQCSRTSSPVKSEGIGEKRRLSDSVTAAMTSTDFSSSSSSASGYVSMTKRRMTSQWFNLDTNNNADDRRKR